MWLMGSWPINSSPFEVFKRFIRLGSRRDWMSLEGAGFLVASKVVPDNSLCWPFGDRLRFELLLTPAALDAPA